MAATDLYLRHPAKVSPTDLWLHPAGPSGSIPPTISDSGTVTGVALFFALEALAEDDTAVAASMLEGAEALAQSGTVITASDFSASETLTEVVLLESGSLRIPQTPTMPFGAVSTPTEPFEPAATPTTPFAQP